MDLQSILSKTAGRRQRIDDEGTTVPSAPHVATEDRPYDHDLLPEAQGGSEKGIKADQRGSDPSPKGINDPTKGNQGGSEKGIKADQRESDPLPKGINDPTKGNQAGSEKGIKADQRESDPLPKGINDPTKGNQAGSEKGIKADQRESDPLPKGINDPTKGNQTPHDSLCNPARFPLTLPLIPFDHPTKGNQTPHDSLCNPARFPFEPERSPTLKGNQTTPIPTSLPTSPQQRDILCQLAHGQAESGLDHTPRIQRRAIAERLGTTAKTVKLQLQRLVRSGHIRRVSTRHGRGHSGTVYALPVSLLPLLENAHKGNQQDANKGVDKGNQQRESHPRSSSLTITTTNDCPAPPHTDKTIAEHLHLLVARFNLDIEFKIGPNDLLGIWRHGSFPTVDDFAESIEHLAFYLRSDQAAGIEHPKAWMMRQLRNGYYAVPAGFVSWDEQIAMAKLKASQDKLRRLREMDREQFDTDFEVWFLERTETERRDMLKGSFFAKTPNSQAARVVLRQRFCELTGRANPYAEQERGGDDSAADDAS